MAKALSLAASKIAAKFGGLFASAVDDEVTIRTKKYRTSNDSLRGELAKAKAKIEGLEAEFKPQVARAKAAEANAAKLEEKLAASMLTVEALQSQNVKMAAAAK